MKPRLIIFVLGAIALWPNSCVAQNGEVKIVKGWVLDSACAFTKDLSKPISRNCAVACARKGSPLVVLRNDGSIYWPISEATPAEGQNERLIPFAGKRVNAIGKIYIRGGSNAIAIQKVTEADDR